MKYLRRFDSHNNYETFAGSNDFELPNISVCGKSFEAEVHYNTAIVQHEYVDLGLPSGTLWATCNIGASTPYETGLYFAWGETTGYTEEQVGVDRSFTLSDYIFPIDAYNSPNYNIPKYNNSDGKHALDPEDDAATANWGAKWHIPTPEQILELTNNNYTTRSWDTYNDVLIITSNFNGNSIVFPITGYVYDGAFRNEKYPIYLSNSLSDGNNNSHILNVSVYVFRETGNIYGENYTRSGGFTIRPVCNSSNT